MTRKFANVTLLLVLAVMFAGTAVSTYVGTGLLFGATIVILWNIYR